MRNGERAERTSGGYGDACTTIERVEQRGTMTDVEEGTKACEDSANMENERKEGRRRGGGGRVIAGETKRAR